MVKPMVDYLKKYSNLQGLTVSGNLFNNNTESGGISSSSQTPEFPHCYEQIIIGLKNLKYLDYRPVDPDYVKFSFRESLLVQKIWKELKQMTII